MDLFSQNLRGTQAGTHTRPTKSHCGHRWPPRPKSVTVAWRTDHTVTTLNQRPRCQNGSVWSMDATQHIIHQHMDMPELRQGLEI